MADFVTPTDRAVFHAALAKAGWTPDDVREWREVKPGVWHVLIHTHRVVWYTLTADGRASAR